MPCALRAQAITPLKFDPPLSLSSNHVSINLSGYVPTTRTVNGHALSSNVTVTASDLSLVIGTNVEAWDADLDTWATLTPSANFQTMVPHTFAQMRTDLGLVIGTNVEAWDADLDTWATLTPSANFQTLVPHTFAQMRSDLGLVIGTNIEVWDADLDTWATLTPTTVGQSLVTLTNPGAITFIRVNADNTVTARSAANFRSDIGAGTGNGDALTANPLSQFASTTSSQFKGVISDENAPDGASSKVIMALGSLSIASGKTFTSSNTLTLTATDGSTLAIGGGGTLGTAAYTASTDYQPLDSDLTTIAGLTATTDNFIVSVSSAWASRSPSQVRTTLGLVVGTNVEAWDADLDTWATLTPSANFQTLVPHTFAQMRTDLSLVVGTNVEAWDADLDTWAGITPGSGVGTFLATPSSANLATAVTDETGSGALVFGTSPTLATPNVGAMTSTVSTTAKKIPVFASTGNANMPVQSAIWSSRIFYWFSQATSSGVIGPNLAMTSGGTLTNPTLATTNLYTIQPRNAYASVITTTNQQVGIRPSNVGLWLRGASAGQGGFLFVCRFGIETWTAGDRLFVGLASANTALTTSDPSALTNMLGFGIDAGDTAITFMHNDGSGTATKTAISGTTLASLQGYDAYIFCKPNDTTVYYRLDDVNAGTTLVDTSTATDLPVNTTFLTWGAVMGNAANTAVTAAQVGNSSVYVESDR